MRYSLSSCRNATGLSATTSPPGSSLDRRISTTAPFLCELSIGCNTGVVIEEVVVDCPHCGEHVALDVDTTAGPEQSYFEDCPVCCRPMEVFVRSRPGEVLSISVSAD